MSQIDDIKNKLNQIKTEKDTKIIPENIRKGITIFDIEGLLSSGIKIFASEQEMNSSVGNVDGDLALVYLNEQGVTIESGTNYHRLYFPKTVTRTSTQDIYLDGSISDGTFYSINSGNNTLNFDIPGEYNSHDTQYNVHIKYTSEDGVTYTRIAPEGDETYQLDFIDNDYIMFPSYYHKDLRLFIQGEKNYFGGLYEYKGNGWITARNLLSATSSDLYPGKNCYSKNGVITSNPLEFTQKFLGENLDMNYQFVTPYSKVRYTRNPYYNPLKLGFKRKNENSNCFIIKKSDFDHNKRYSSSYLGNSNGNNVGPISNISNNALYIQDHNSNDTFIIKDLSDDSETKFHHYAIYKIAQDMGYTSGFPRNYYWFTFLQNGTSYLASYVEPSSSSPGCNIYVYTFDENNNPVRNRIVEVSTEAVSVRPIVGYDNNLILRVSQNNNVSISKITFDEEDIVLTRSTSIAKDFSSNWFSYCIDKDNNTLSFYLQPKIIKVHLDEFEIEEFEISSNIPKDYDLRFIIENEDYYYLYVVEQTYDEDDFETRIYKPKLISLNKSTQESQIIFSFQYKVKEIWEGDNPRTEVETDEILDYDSNIFTNYGSIPVKIVNGVIYLNGIVRIVNVEKMKTKEGFYNMMSVAKNLPLHNNYPLDVTETHVLFGLNHYYGYYPYYNINTESDKSIIFTLDSIGGNYVDNDARMYQYIPYSNYKKVLDNEPDEDDQSQYIAQLEQQIQDLEGRLDSINNE